MSLINVSNIRKSYGNTDVLCGVDFTIQDKEHCVIHGSSGSGKSTFLYLLGGLETPTSGQIIINNYELSQLNDEQLASYRNNFVGLIFQFHFLLPSMNCIDNILLPCRIGGHSLRAVKKRTMSMVERLGVSHCLNKYPFEISGGEQQRINIIRALSLKPKLLLCDEPTGNLDSKNSQKVITLLKELAKAEEVTMVIVTHDKKVATQFPTEYVMEDGVLYTNKATKGVT